MAISKVTLNGETLMDVTQDTVATNNLLTGETAHGADGEPVIGAYSGGGGGETTAGQKDVNFIDYDGTIRYSYTASEFAALTALPANPSHSGLTAQGWNWSLADAKAYVAKYGKLWIGQMYITDDGKTRIYIHLEEGRTSPMLGCCPNGTVVVDWGDGSATETLTGTSTTDVKWTQTHNYAVAGDYMISLNVTSGTVELSGLWDEMEDDHDSYMLRYASTYDNRNHCYQNAIQKVEIGLNTTLGYSAFYCCYSLASITIPDSVTGIRSGAFEYCYSLTSITIPDSVTGIDSNAFDDCNSFVSISIPDSVEYIEDAAFQNCYSLTSITIPNSVTMIGGYAFYKCCSLASVIIPDSVEYITSSAFQNCYSLTNVAISDSVGVLSGSVFSSCYSLVSVTISNSVTSIESYAFAGCLSLVKIRFEPTTPPTVEKSSTFTNIPTDCVISVPTGTLSAYTSATNYPDPATYTYIEE